MAHRPAPARMLAGIARRIPATLAVVAVLLLAGILSRGLWEPLQESPLWGTFAYGLPALEAGRWWTPVTGTFLVAQPWIFLTTLLSFAGMGYLEYRRGSRTALAYFAVGQLFAVFATALVLWLCRGLDWPWAQAAAGALDVGPSGGSMACLAAAVALLVPPWRLRAWLLLVAYIFIALLFWGTLADLEHLAAVVLILAVERSLRPQRATVRELRLIAAIMLLTLAVGHVILLVVPTFGPFGRTAAFAAPWYDLAFDVAVILLIAHGMRRGRRWAWLAAVALCVLNIGIGIAVMALVGTLGVEPIEAALGADISVQLATSVVWALALAFFVLARRAFQARRRTPVGDEVAPTRDEVVDEIHTFGGGTLSWMTTWEGNTYARVGGGIVAFRDRNAVALALGDPLGPTASRASAVTEFIRGSEAAGLIPCFFSAGESTRAAVPADWRSLIVAEDTIVDLPGLAFTGKVWGDVRTSLNRAAREGMTFRMSRLRDESWGVQQQLRAISESWVGEKDLPEMGFTLGTLAEAADPEVRLALAVSPAGDVDGFVSWLPVYGEGVVRGWTLDLMRRREGGFGPVMEFLIGSSARMFADEGAEIMSLSGAPLTHEYPADAGAIADLTTWLAGVLEPVYGFSSLHRFKQKFNPRYETMYLLYRDEGDLARIGAALTRAFLPTATLRQFAGAGIELVRGER